MSDRKATKKAVKSEAQAVRAILNEWDPIPGSPADEYDCLIDHIVSALHQGKTQRAQIAALISSELENHFGITSSEADVIRVAASIQNLWEQRTP